MNDQIGVYFRREDYAPFWIRIVADVVDLFTFGLICLLLLTSAAILIPDGRSFFDVASLLCVAAAIGYFILLKRSRFRTVGYRVGRIRVVGLDGLPPSHWSLLVRLSFAFLGPVNWLIDLIWLTDDPHRQALRDKMANTYSVRVKARPAGQGRVVFREYRIFFFNFLFREVERT